MLKDETLRSAGSFWAAFLGCDAGYIGGNRIVIVPQPVEEAHESLYVFIRGEGAIVAVQSQSPALPAEQAMRAVGGRAADELLDPAFWKRTFPGISTASKEPASICLVDGETFRPAAGGITARPISRVSRPENAALRSFFGECSIEDWEMSGIDFDHPYLAGAFEDERLVALASGEHYSGALVHAGVIAHPDFRGRGYATAALGKLVSKVIAEGLIVQVREDPADPESAARCEVLGFQEFCRVLALERG